MGHHLLKQRSVTSEKRWKIFAQKWCVFGGRSESFGMSVILAAPWIQGVTVEEDSLLHHLLI